MLSANEILLILDVLRDKYGPGYSDEKNVGRLQAKLSIMLEVASMRENKEQTEVSKSAVD